jgi:hypothetical protein
MVPAVLVRLLVLVLLVQWLSTLHRMRATTTAAVRAVTAHTPLMMSVPPTIIAATAVVVITAGAAVALTPTHVLRLSLSWVSVPLLWLLVWLHCAASQTTTARVDLALAPVLVLPAEVVP